MADENAIFQKQIKRFSYKKNTERVQLCLVEGGSQCPLAISKQLNKTNILQIRRCILNFLVYKKVILC